MNCLAVALFGCAFLRGVPSDVLPVRDQVRPPARRPHPRAARGDLSPRRRLQGAAVGPVSRTGRGPLPRPPHTRPSTPAHTRPVSHPPFSLFSPDMGRSRHWVAAIDDYSPVHPLMVVAQNALRHVWERLGGGLLGKARAAGLAYALRWWTGGRPKERLLVRRAGFIFFSFYRLVLVHAVCSGFHVHEMGLLLSPVPCPAAAGTWRRRTGRPTLCASGP